jgi:hypothetical protein
MFKHLTVDRMITTSLVWVTLPEAKALFLSIPEIAALYPKLARVHTELERVRPGGVTPPPALRKVIDDLAALDQAHDTLARAVWSGLQAEQAYCLAEQPPALERARRAQSVATSLFPGGLRIVNASVIAELGHALRATTLLERQPKIRAFLEEIPVRAHGTLLALTQRWLAVGRQLGDLESERGVLQAAHGRKRVTKAAMNAIRGRWIRLVSLVLSNLELSDAPRAAIETIRRPLLAASRKPSKRKAGEAKTGEAKTAKAAGAATPATGDATSGTKATGAETGRAKAGRAKRR